MKLDNCLTDNQQLFNFTMIDETKNPWKVLSTKPVHETPWIKITHHDVINPAGNSTVYTTVNFKNYAIAVIPLDENYNTWIVGQYRFPINEYSWEIIEGGGPIELSPQESAARELKEEAGITAKVWHEIYEFHASNSATDELAKVFVAKDLSFGESCPEESEELQVKKIPFQELVSMVYENKVKDSLTIISVLITDKLIKEGKL